MSVSPKNIYEPDLTEVFTICPLCQQARFLDLNICGGYLLWGVDVPQWRINMAQHFMLYAIIDHMDCSSVAITDMTRLIGDASPPVPFCELDITCMYFLSSKINEDTKQDFLKTLRWVPSMTGCTSYLEDWSSAAKVELACEDALERDDDSRKSYAQQPSKKHA